jgi:hypothetical protein
MSSITLSIKGRDWAFILMADKRFDKLHNNLDNQEGLNVAMTVGAIYEVHFRKSNWDLITIRHEIFHVLYNMSLSGSAELTPSQVEEISAEIVGHHSLEICLWTDRIAEKFLGRE